MLDPLKKDLLQARTRSLENSTVDNDRRAETTAVFENVKDIKDVSFHPSGPRVFCFMQLNGRDLSFKMAFKISMVKWVFT